MTVSADAIFCGNCGAQLKEALASDKASARTRCAFCGSTKRIYHEFVAETIDVRDGTAFKVKHGQRKAHYEAKSMPDFSVCYNKLVHRETIIDRENDRYVERVTDYESGNVIHQCDEPLSKHIGHGAARRSSPPDV